MTTATIETSIWDIQKEWKRKKKKKEGIAACIKEKKEITATVSIRRISLSYSSFLLWFWQLDCSPVYCCKLEVKSQANRMYKLLLSKLTLKWQTSTSCVLPLWSQKPSKQPSDFDMKNECQLFSGWATLVKIQTSWNIRVEQPLWHYHGQLCQHVGFLILYSLHETALPVLM